MTTSYIVRLGSIGTFSAIATIIVNEELASVRIVEGNSMQPTFNPHWGQRNEILMKLLNESGISGNDVKRELNARLTQDRIIYNKWSIRDKMNLRVGDVVVLEKPSDRSRDIIKRIKAMPGDSIYLVDTNEVIVIQDNHCWVEGDNDQSSYDSNDFGQVPLDLIKGRVFFLIWPFNRMKKISCDQNILANSSKTILIRRQVR